MQMLSLLRNVMKEAPFGGTLWLSPKTGIDARVLAELSFRDLVPAIWLPDPQVRSERELARFRLHLVRHRSSLKDRIHSTVITFAKPCPVSDLFGVAGAQTARAPRRSRTWRENIEATVLLIDQLDRQIDAIASELARQRGHDVDRVPGALLEALWSLSRSDMAARSRGVEIPRPPPSAKCPRTPGESQCNTILSSTMPTPIVAPTPSSSARS